MDAGASSRFRHVRRVEFADTDMAGILHFARYFCYMEEAEHAMLRSLGMTVHQKGADQIISWPRVSAKCDFRAPARFEDELDIEVGVARLGSKSATFAFDMRRKEILLAQGEITAVCCLVGPEGPIRSIAIPADIVTKLNPFLIS